MLSFIRGCREGEVERGIKGGEGAGVSRYKFEGQNSVHYTEQSILHKTQGA